MPSVYVGTYAKYNNGSIAGAWLDLEDYRDTGEFYGACIQLHNDEHDPEFMFQDWEDIPDKFIGESSLSADVYPMWVSLDAETRKMCATYWDNVDPSASAEEVQERFAGTFTSEEEWAADFWGSTGLIGSIPENLQAYIDYEAYARDCRLGGDMTFVHQGSDVLVFHNN